MSRKSQDSPGDGPVARIFDVGRRTRAELRELGRSLRKQAARKSHATWEPSPDRPDPVELLRAQDPARIQELVPIRYGRMVASPFACYRGAAAVMASDLAATPHIGVFVQACCDAHCQNFGLYGSPERQVVFDVNDFDETLPAPWEFDLKRLAASVVLESRENGFDEDRCAETVQSTVRQYCDVIRESSELTNLEIHYRHLSEEQLLAEIGSRRLRKAAREPFKKARTRTSLQLYERWVRREGDDFRFIEDPPILVRLCDEETERFHQLFNRYGSTLQENRCHLLRQYCFRDAARRVVGVGSVGLGAYVVLLKGRGDPDPLLIQIKEATSSVMTPFVGRSGYERHGQRVVVGQRLMQATSDPFLGWAPSEDRDYYLRQLRDMKGPSGSSTDPEIHELEVALCGATLARAHARSVDPGLLAGYLGKSDRFVDAICQFAFAYSDQAERDHRRLSKAAKSGEIPCGPDLRD
jgi:uncharacterized protein (DUF2252 family)